MRKFLSLILAVLVSATLLAGCTTEQPVITEQETEKTSSATTEAENTESDAGTDEVKKIAFAVNSLDNEIWALTSASLTAFGEEMGYEVTTLSANSNASTQVDQLESCIEAGYDVIALDPVDTSAVEDVCQKALDAGIVVVNYGQEFQNATTSIILDEVNTGTSMGVAAAEWVLENWADKENYKVICVGYDVVPVLITRLDSFKAGFESVIPDAEFVTDINGGSAAESMTSGESALQANPDINVCLAIGGDQAYGFVQAAIAAGIPEEDLVAFAIDATEQSMKMLKSGEYIKGIMSVGSVDAKAKLLIETIDTIVTGGEVPEKTYFDEDWIDATNIEEKFVEYGFTE